MDAIGAAELERHLEACPDCESSLAAEEGLRATLAGSQLYERAPETLRRKLQISLPKAAVPPPVKRSRDDSWRWLAIAATVVLVAILRWQYAQKLKRFSQQEHTMAAVIVDAHLRSLQPGHLEDVISTDQHTVKPWFDGKIDFAPPVRDFTEQGYPLQGGRLDVVDNRTVAALVYGRRKHVVNVFVWPTSEKDVAPQSGSIQGYQWIDWRKQGMEFYAVSDAAATDLQQLQHLFSN